MELTSFDGQQTLLPWCGAIHTDSVTVGNLSLRS
jgi:hypothetical protein